MEFVAVIVLGVIAGVMSGMFGIGGGAIIVPSLMLLFPYNPETELGFTQTLANGTSLAALLLPVGIFACIAYYRSGKLKIAPALAVALGLTFASWIGASIALSLPRETLKAAYGVFLLYMAWRYISPRKWYWEWQGQGTEVVAEDTDINPRDPKILAIAFGIGLFAGVASGLFGIGGGVVIVPALMILLNFDQKLATGTSLGALLLPVGLLGMIRYSQAAVEGAATPLIAYPGAGEILGRLGDVDLSVAAPIALMLLIGAIFGAKITLGLPTKTIRRLYGFFLLFVGLRFLFG